MLVSAAAAAAVPAAWRATPTLLRHMSTLHALLGAPPAPQHQQLEHGGSSSSSRSGDGMAELGALGPGLPEQHGGQLPQQPGCELPSLCGEPKFKLSLHRRGHRRTPYYAKRKELFAYCKHCGQTGMPHQYFAAGQGCTGDCLGGGNSKAYPKEYKPPV